MTEQRSSSPAPWFTPRLRHRAYYHPLTPSARCGHCHTSSRRRRSRHVGGQAQVPQNPPRHGRRLDQCDEPQSTATAGARQQVDLERAAHHVGPRRSADRRATGRTGRRRIDVRVGRGPQCATRHHLGTPRGTRRQEPVAQHEVHARARHEHGEPFQEGRRRECHMRRAVGPRVTQLPHHLALGRQLQPRPSHRRAQRIAAHALEPGAHPACRLGEERLQVLAYDAMQHVRRGVARGGSAPTTSSA